MELSDVCSVEAVDDGYAIMLWTPGGSPIRLRKVTQASVAAMEAADIARVVLAWREVEV